jgi:hypothetical protein
MIALFIDAGSRAMSVTTVNATRITEGEALVLRKGVEVGSLSDLAKMGPLPHPVLVCTREFSAHTSAGFTGVKGRRAPTPIVGVMGWWKGGLKVLRNPWGCHVLPAGSTIVHHEVHQHSNAQTAAAVSAAAVLMGQMRPQSIFIEEGQSDYSCLYEVRHEESAPELVFPDEHQAEKFSDGELAVKFLGYRAEDAGRQFLALLCIEEEKGNPFFLTSFLKEGLRLTDYQVKVIGRSQEWEGLSDKWDIPQGMTTLDILSEREMVFVQHDNHLPEGEREPPRRFPVTCEVDIPKQVMKFILKKFGRTDTVEENT